MNIEYTVRNGTLFAQAYGVESYGQQQYSSCEQTPEGCIPISTTTTTPPNTGFFGLPQDAAIASVSGALLLAVAVAGTVYVLLSRRKALKKKEDK